VAYYGLPAAGIICLSLLNQPSTLQQAGVSISRVFQDLGVLVAQVDTGALITVENPNYALMAAATRTVKSILDRLSISVATTTTATAAATQNQSNVAPIPATTSGGGGGDGSDGNVGSSGEVGMNLEPWQPVVQEDWTPWIQQNAWDFELDFWNELAEHPILMDL